MPTESSDLGLHRAKECARALLNAADAPALLVGADGRVVYANPSAEVRFGSADLVGAAVSSHPDGSAARWVRNPLGTAGEASGLELWWLHQADQLAGPRAPDSMIPFRALVENVVLGVLVFELLDPDDPAGMVLRYVNPAMSSVIGVDMTRYVGQAMRAFSPGAVARGRAEQIASVAKGGGPRLLDLNYYEAGSAVAGADELWIETRVFSVGGALIGLASENVTRRERANRAAVAMNEALARSNAELDRFASVASHDLQEPLRKVMSFGDRLASHAGSTLDERGHDYLQRMRSASSRMRDLIDDLLRLSRVTGMERETNQVSLGATVADVMVDLEAAIAENGARVEVGPLPTVAGNSTLFRQLLQNLLGNALKFQPPGQAARISIRQEAAPASPQVTILIDDNGIGIAPEHAKRIFEPFQRLHGRGEYAGTGIGLAICDRIVAKHGGTLTVDPEYTDGTRFRLTLPRQAVAMPGDVR